MFRRTLARVRVALRLAFFLRVDEEEVRGSWLEVAIAALLVALVPTLYDVVQYRDNGRLALDQLPSVLVIFALAFMTATVVAETLRRAAMVQALLLALLLAWVAVDALVVASWLALMFSPAGAAVSRFGYLTFVATVLWAVLAFARFTWGLRAASRPRRLAAAPLALVLFALPMAFLSPDRALWARDWSRDSDGSGGDRWAAASEEFLYGHQDVLARELAAVAPHRKGLVDVYFIGMAGHGYQDVFMREVDSVAELMRERFDADGHIVKLVNNPKTLRTNPIASVTSLRAALRRVAAQMDVQEDVLVLFLTSHGSEQHRFSLDLWPVRFTELDPATLRAMLDEAGIRNRVVIVSACYSGGFVAPLKDDNSLVITAAAPDRNSFGCGNENQWTYFGKAYFDEALRKTSSFTRAFDNALPVIAEREKAQSHTPSNPMIAAGDGIRAKLAQLEAQLSAPGTPLTPAVDVATPAPSPAAPSLDPAVVERYLDATFSEALAAQYREACLVNMRLSSPERLVERNPQAYGGFDKRHRLWPRLSSAWEEHAQRACKRAYDPALLRSSYGEELARVAGAEELDAAVRFVATPQGKAWLDRIVEAEARHTIRMVPVHSAIFEESYRLYAETERQVQAELQRSRTAQR